MSEDEGNVPRPIYIPTEEEIKDSWDAQFNFPPEAEFDFRPPELDFDSETSTNPHIIALVDRYLEEARAKKSVREHIPTLLTLAGTRIADRRNAARPIHFFGPDTPFRYVLHLTQIGGSGTDKGATVETFYRIVGSNSDADHPIFPVEEYKGGSLESLRGGTTVVGNRRYGRAGGVERTDQGFVYIPEFTQLADLAERSAGAIQTVIAWADTARMTFDTISGGYASYRAPASLILGLQTTKLTDVEDVVLGWNRRSIYDEYAAPMTESLLPSKREETVAGNSSLLEEARGAFRSLWKNWRPTSLRWGPFHEWLEDAYTKQHAVAIDEQMLYSLAIGHHIVTGGPVAGDVEILMTPDLERIFGRVLWYKRLARISVKARTAQSVAYVVKDPYLFGGGRMVEVLDLVRILAGRLSIQEDLVREVLPMLTGKGILESIIEGKDTYYRLARK